MAPASAPGSAGGTSKASVPSVTVPVTPSIAVATTGFPAAIASSRAIGWPSRREGMTKTSSVFRKAGTWGVKPVRMTLPSSPRSTTRSLSDFSLSPSPAMTQTVLSYSAPSLSRSTDIASIRYSSPFCQTSLAAQPTTRFPASPYLAANSLSGAAFSNLSASTPFGIKDTLPGARPCFSTMNFSNAPETTMILSVMLSPSREKNP